jgi:phosphoglycolate phosphatase
MARLYASTTPVLPGTGLEEFNHIVENHYRHHNPFSHTILFPGMKVLLQHCRRERIPCYIVTNKPAEPLEKILKGKGWDCYFQDWICPDSIDGCTLKKTDMVRLLSQKYSIGGETVFIGDTFSDILAAKQCGMTSIGVLYGDGDPALLIQEKPEFTARSPREIENILFP